MELDFVWKHRRVWIRKGIASAKIQEFTIFTTHSSFKGLGREET